jgi:DNA-binding NarL/FixJ family response regulator
MPKARLILVDDQKLLSDALCLLLKPDFEVVASVSDGWSAVYTFERLRPDLMITEIRLPLLNGLEVARQVKRIAPSARVLFCTIQTDKIYLEQVFRAGAAGYVLKQASFSDLLDAIKAVLRGRRYVSPMLMARMGDLPTDSAPDPTQFFGSELTQRQREVLQLIAEGGSMKQIAYALRISVRTVEFHKKNVMQQLRLYSTAELTKYAVEQKLTEGTGLGLTEWRLVSRNAGEPNPG